MAPCFVAKRGGLSIVASSLPCSPTSTREPSKRPEVRIRTRGRSSSTSRFFQYRQPDHPVWAALTSRQPLTTSATRTSPTRQRAETVLASDRRSGVHQDLSGRDGAAEARRARGHQRLGRDQQRTDLRARSDVDARRAIEVRSGSRFYGLTTAAPLPVIVMVRATSSVPSVGSLVPPVSVSGAPAA